MRTAPLLVAALSLLSTRARAQDRFEIQVYDSETAPAGGFGLETHVNHVAAGTSTAVDGEAPSEHQTHLTFEPHLGLTPWCELGAYFQLGFDADGSGHWAGFKGRFKARLPRRYLRGLFGFALNGEISVIPARYEINVLGSELRPIVDLAWRRLYASLNPIIDVDLLGPYAGRPQLEPAATVTVAATRALAFGVEYYAAFGPVTHFAATSGQTHLLFAVVNVLHAISPKLEVAANFGVGYNLADNGERWVVKAIVGIGR
jgi:hypothetical protein